ncbi:MAG: hypothetical protein IJJ22_02260 [Oscillospiraceae bacterium]|nr:hypothetical protein [Oscillospiraceae bacterium]
MIEYPQEFKNIVENARSYSRPWRIAVAGSDNENILKGVFEAQDAGFAEPVLIGSYKKTKAILDSLGLADRNYDFYPVTDNTSPVQYAIEMIRAGSADVLMRGNVQTRDFLLPILNKANHLIKDDRLVTQINVMKLPDHDRLIAVSDVTLLIEPTIEQREMVIKNMVEVLLKFGVKTPNIALLSLVEKPSFHMKDTVEAQTIVMHHNDDPIADCKLYGPITYDLIISKEAARLKHFECEACGEFDGIVVPNLLAGNLICKFWDSQLNALGCGVIAGTNIPIAISGRSETVEHAFLSLAASIAMAD